MRSRTHSRRLGFSEMKEVSEVSWCLKSEMVLMCRDSVEVGLRLLLLPIHSNGHILTVCIGIPCSTGFCEDAVERSELRNDM